MTREYDRPFGFEVGDGATLHFYSDSAAYTVIAVSKSGKQITIQRDKATRDPNWKPEVYPGGFAGHVANNYDQTYTYEQDPQGSTRIVRLTQRGWMSKGQPVSKGRREFCDYNF